MSLDNILGNIQVGFFFAAMLFMAGFGLFAWFFLASADEDEDIPFRHVRRLRAAIGVAMFSVGQFFPRILPGAPGWVMFAGLTALALVFSRPRRPRAG